MTQKSPAGAASPQSSATDSDPVTAQSPRAVPAGDTQKALPIDVIQSLRLKIEERSIPEPNSGCWLWEKATNGKYGKLRIRALGNLLFAHRVSFAAHNDGYLPPVVMHKCDVTTCVNPSHLMAGTQRDNTADAIAKGRASKPPILKGEKHGRARLTLADVAAIRELSSTDTIADIARRFSVGESTIRHIKRGNTWRGE